MNTINSELAEEFLQRGSGKADEMGVAVCIAVVDTGAHLKAFLRMDDAIAGVIDVAQRKARTAALFPGDTGDFGHLIADQQLTGMALSNGGLAAFPGGLPIYGDDNMLIGAIGVSGASAEQDRAVARFALGLEEGG